MIYISFRKQLLKTKHMKKMIFSAVCGVFLFVLLLTTACSNTKKESVVSEEAVEYATDPLDAKIAEILNKDNDLIFFKEGEQIEETDEGNIRHCPVKFVNEMTGAVTDTVFVFEENY